MTEREKMLSGELYDSSDNELEQLRLHARKLARRYNLTDEDQQEVQTQILRELLPATEELPYLQAPVYFDYGCHTYFGKYSSANFNFTCLDVGEIHIGDNVMIGPNVKFTKEGKTIMEKIKKRIANLKVAGKLKVYQMTVLVMTLFLVLVALISTLVIRSNIEKITEVWSPSLEYLQDLETMTAKYRIKQYQHLVESDDAVMNSCEEEIQKLESQIQDTDANLDAIMSADSDAQKGQDDYEVANAAWEEYRAASDEILKLSREGKQQEAAKLMTGEVYEEYKAFAEKLTILCDKFQVELDQAKDHGQCMHHNHIYCDRGSGSCDCCSDNTDRKDHYQFHYRAGRTDRGSSCQPAQGRTVQRRNAYL